MRRGDRAGAGTGGQGRRQGTGGERQRRELRRAYPPDSAPTLPALNYPNPTRHLHPSHAEDPDVLESTSSPPLDPTSSHPRRPVLLSACRSWLSKTARLTQPPPNLAPPRPRPSLPMPPWTLLPACKFVWRSPVSSKSAVQENAAVPSLIIASPSTRPTAVPQDARTLLQRRRRRSRRRRRRRRRSRRRQETDRSHRCVTAV